MSGCIQMTLKGADYSKPENRADLANYLALLLNASPGYRRNDDIPYMPNAGDDSYWTLDTGNNFKVMFTAGEPTNFALVHRYLPMRLYPLMQFLRSQGFEVADTDFGHLAELAVARAVQAGDADLAKYLSELLLHPDNHADELAVIQERIRTNPFNEQLPVRPE